MKKYDIRFDIHTKEEPYFLVANAAIRKARGNRYVPLHELLTLDSSHEGDRKKLQDLAREIKVQGLCDGMDAMEVYTRLDRVRKIRDNEIVKLTIDQELEDVVEIFSRLNSKGTRVTEADIYLGIVASKSPGWVRTEFLPFLAVLGNDGFHVDPNLLFRTVTAIGIGKVRFKEIGKDFWEPDKIHAAWGNTKDSWKSMIRRLQAYGILSDEALPTSAALITLVALANRFNTESDFDPAIYWFVQASRFSRYSGSGTTALDEDLKDVKSADSFVDAIVRLLRRMEGKVKQPVDADLFKRDYTDGRFGRFLLYLMVYRNKARDWDESGTRLGFEGAEVLADFKPQWHHIYPQKFLAGKVDDDMINWLANIAVIGPNINIRISAQDPMKYLDKYKIGTDKLGQQFIDWDRASFTIANYPAFLEKRAAALAKEANEFLLSLSPRLPEDCKASPVAAS